MYYSDYNHFNSDEKPVECFQYHVHEDAQPPKKKRLWPKIAALCLSCALLGGAVGGLGTAALGGAFGGGSGTVLYQGESPTAVTLSNVEQNEPMTAAQIYAAYVGSTVGITTEVNTNVYGQVVQTAASGSGFIVSQNGYIVTNYHVIEDADSIQVTLYDGRSYPATLVGGDEDNDVAVLKIEETGLTPVVIGSSDSLVVGDQVFAIGNPLGELTFSLTGGYVSALDRNVTMSDGSRMNYIQTDTAINSGNSGGPLFNTYGQVVGIVTAKLSSSGSSTSASVEGLGFAIPMDNVKNIITDLIEHGYVTGKPYLGLVSTNVSGEAQRYGTPAGAYVLGVVEGSCSANVGVQTGDIITAFNGEAITSADELTNAVSACKAGDEVTLTIVRSGQTVTATLTLEERDAAREQAIQELYDQIQQEQYEQYQQQQQQSGWGYGFPFGW